MAMSNVAGVAHCDQTTENLQPTLQSQLKAQSLLASFKFLFYFYAGEHSGAFRSKTARCIQQGPKNKMGLNQRVNTGLTFVEWSDKNDSKLILMLSST